MAYRGRGFWISDQACEIADRLVANLPQDKIYRPPQTAVGPGGVRFGLRISPRERLKFQDTDEERSCLKEMARAYNMDAPLFREPLMAHGTDSPGSLCQILLDGVLKHYGHHVTYGNLEMPNENTQTGGYWDHGWGVFVVTPRTYSAASQRKTQHIEIPIDDLEALVLPTPIVDMVRIEFPKHREQIKGYRQFANELAAVVEDEKKHPIRTALFDFWFGLTKRF